jgi:prepilin-type N-terminal cleavage/methylation domain-containing protein
MTAARAMRRRRPSAGGFTLLEIMVALAILSSTLVVLLRIVTNNVRATNHAKMTTAATFLARTKMVELEDTVLYDGFIETNEFKNGTFKTEGYPQFRWDTSIERIELPTNLAQQTQDEARAATDKAKGDPMAMMSGFLGGMMSTFIEPIRIGLQESVRKVTVRVSWDEIGRRDQSFEVVQYLTDPAKLDLALTGGAPGGAGAPGQMPLGGQRPGGLPGGGMPGGLPGGLPPGLGGGR